MPVSSLYSGLAAAILTPVIIKLLCGPGERPAQIGQYQVCEYGRGMKIVMLIGLCFFSLATLGVIFFPGKTPPSQIPLILGVFLAFASLNLFAYRQMARSTILWNEEHVQGADFWGRRSTIGWSQLQKAEYVDWMQSLRLTGSDGAQVLAYDLMNGVSEFYSSVTSHCKTHGRELPNLPKWGDFDSNPDQD